MIKSACSNSGMALYLVLFHSDTFTGLRSELIDCLCVINDKDLNMHILDILTQK